MKKIAISCPLNNLSFGNFSYNILREIQSRDITACIFPVSNQVDLSAFDKTLKDFADWVQYSIYNRYKNLEKDIPYLNIWHLQGAESTISSNSLLYTFHETSKSTQSERNICSLYKKVLFSSKYSRDIFQNEGASNCEYVNPGFDKDFFRTEDHKLRIKYILASWENGSTGKILIKSLKLGPLFMVITTNTN